VTPHEVAVRELLAALRVHSGGGWSWFGRRRDLPSIPVEDTSIRRHAAMRELRDHLYGRFYVTGGPAPGGPPGAPDTAQWLSERLMRIGASMTSRQPGWRVVRAQRRVLILEQSGLTVRATASDIAGGAPRAGELVEAYVPGALEAAQGGFVLLLGRRTLSEVSEDPVDRIYWHVRASAAPPLASMLAGDLDGRDVPFRLKVLAAPGLFVRCDAAILHVPRRDRKAAVAIARDVRGRMRDGMVDATPVFTRRLAGGVALAEEPPGGESFGMHRCALLADALLMAAERAVTDEEGRMAIVRERFADEGIALEAAWRTAPAA
jgi:hypothetical protein